jgi:hypothetical protein
MIKIFFASSALLQTLQGLTVAVTPFVLVKGASIQLRIRFWPRGD